MRTQSNYNGNVHLDDFGANLKGASTELLACTVRVLSVHHTDVSTASRRNHLHTNKDKLYYAGHEKVKQQDTTVELRGKIDLNVIKEETEMGVLERTRIYLR